MLPTLSNLFSQVVRSYTSATPAFGRGEVSVLFTQGVLFPGASAMLHLREPRDILLFQESKKERNGLVVLTKEVPRQRTLLTDWQGESVGTLAKIQKLCELSNNDMIVMVKGMDRVTIDHPSRHLFGFWEGIAETLPDATDKLTVGRALASDIKLQLSYHWLQLFGKLNIAENAATSDPFLAKILQTKRANTYGMPGMTKSQYTSPPTPSTPIKHRGSSRLSFSSTTESPTLPSLCHQASIQTPDDLRRAWQRSQHDKSPALTLFSFQIASLFQSNNYTSQAMLQMPSAKNRLEFLREQIQSKISHAHTPRLSDAPLTTHPSTHQRTSL